MNFSQRPFLLRRLRFGLRAYLAEFIGTFVMMVVGLGACIQFSLLHPTSESNYLSVWICWGIAVMCGIYVSGGISGAHMNPGVSLAFAMHGKFPWRHVPGYLFAQLSGAFMAAAFTFIFYLPEILRRDPLLEHIHVGMQQSSTSALFYVTRPRYHSNWQQLLCESMTTMLFMLVLFSIGNARNSVQPRHGLEAIAVGATVTGIGASLGSSGGYALNSFRDLGPRLFTALVFGKDVFSTDSWYFFVPLCGPIIGAVFGSTVHELLCVYDRQNELLSDSHGDSAESVGDENGPSISKFLASFV